MRVWDRIDLMPPPCVGVITHRDGEQQNTGNDDETAAA